MQMGIADREDEPTTITEMRAVIESERERSGFIDTTLEYARTHGHHGEARYVLLSYVSLQALERYTAALCDLVGQIESGAQLDLAKARSLLAPQE